MESDRHPCFSGCASKRYGRVHLPVAVGCNVRCNYCDRRYSCVNENRPGVSAKILRPEAVLDYLGNMIAQEPRISVVGIAGPGDPLCNPYSTIEILQSVHDVYPHLLLCLATNGLNLPDHVDSLVEIGLRHITVTVNTVDPEVGARIYSRVRVNKIDYLGREGAEILLSRQLEGIKQLKRHGVVVKVNTVLIPGINETHVRQVAATAARLGVDLMNCIPMIPVKNTPFGDKQELNKKKVEEIRQIAERYLPQMRHCKRCRADASGMLDRMVNSDSIPKIQAGVVQ